MKKLCLFLCIPAVFFVVLILINSCNNPFSSRKPDDPGSEGAAIKPANSQDNVLYNLEASFEGLSIQDYLDVFSDDFVFNPDPEDSLKYEEDFINGWDLERETEFANNFLLRQNFTFDVEGVPIFLSPTYEYKPGQDMYELKYQMFIFKAGLTETDYERIEIEGYAWLYFHEDNEGKWSIYKWVDYRLTSNSITWGALRAQYI